MRLFKSVNLNSNSVEIWLSELAEEQQNTLFRNLSMSLNLSQDLSPLLPKLSSQVICLRERIIFARRIEDIFEKHDDTLLTAKEELSQKIQVLASNTAATSNHLQQRKDQALILQTIHQRDIVDTLVKDHCHHKTDWTWQSQLRFSCEAESCNIRIGDALFKYSFEYQGNEENLVNTTLTDKCYLNLTQAMRFGFGGNPFGPAGTGKIHYIK